MWDAFAFFVIFLDFGEVGVPFYFFRAQRYILSITLSLYDSKLKLNVQYSVLPPQEKNQIRVFSCLRISKHLREFAKAGFREFFGVISTSDFTMNFRDFDDDTFLKFPKFLEIHRSFVRDRPVIFV